MAERREHPTQFRLTRSERDFLMLHGKGSLSEGLKIVMKKVGYTTDSDILKKKTKPLVRRDFNFEREEFRYLRIENDKLVYSISVSDSVQRRMIERFGEECFFEEAILRGLFPFPDDLKKLAQVDQIVDLVSKTTLWARDSK